MKILITAFDPFGGDEINPALEAMKLMKSEISGARIVKLEVPTVFNKSIDKVVEAIEKENPDVVLNIGQAGGRFDITPERVDEEVRKYVSQSTNRFSQIPFNNHYKEVLKKSMDLANASGHQNILFEHFRGV